MGGTPLPAADMAALSAYIESLGLHPNPHRNLDRTLPATLGGGNTLRLFLANRQATLYLDPTHSFWRQSCQTKLMMQA